jgi:hypothetical protein
VVLYNIAICWDDLHEWVKAKVTYERYLAESDDLGEERILEVEKRIDFISGHIGSLKVVDAEPGAEIWIDGELVGATPLDDIPLAEGDHEFVRKKPGAADFVDHVTIKAKEVTVVVVSEQAPPTPEPKILSHPA